MNAENIITIFHGLSKDAVSYIFDNSQNKTYEKNQIIFSEGERSGELFLIKSGAVMIYKNIADDKLFLGEIGPGSCFGEMELIDLGPRTASVIASDKLTVSIITKKTLFQLFKLFPQDYLILIHNIAREISRRLRLIDELLVKIECELEKKNITLKIINNEPEITLKG